MLSLCLCSCSEMLYLLQFENVESTESKEIGLRSLPNTAMVEDVRFINGCRRFDSWHHCCSYTGSTVDCIRLTCRIWPSGTVSSLYSWQYLRLITSGINRSTWMDTQRVKGLDQGDGRIYEGKLCLYVWFTSLCTYVGIPR